MVQGSSYSAITTTSIPPSKRRAGDIVVPKRHDREKDRRTSKFIKLEGGVRPPLPLPSIKPDPGEMSDISSVTSPSLPSSSTYSSPQHRQFEDESMFIYLDGPITANTFAPTSSTSTTMPSSSPYPSPPHPYTLQGPPHMGTWTDSRYYIPAPPLAPAVEDPGDRLLRALHGAPAAQHPPPPPVLGGRGYEPPQAMSGASEALMLHSLMPSDDIPHAKTEWRA